MMKSKKEVTRQIKEVIRQITASVTFLPMIDEPCSFDLLVYTDNDVSCRTNLSTLHIWNPPYGGFCLDFEELEGDCVCVCLFNCPQPRNLALKCWSFNATDVDPP